MRKDELREEERGGELREERWLGMTKLYFVLVLYKISSFLQPYTAYPV